MIATSTNIQSRRPVRAPFRVLAAVICVLGAVAVAGTAFIAYTRGIDTVPVKFIAWLPGAVWFIRLAFHAAAHGQSFPGADSGWPFASPRIWNYYWLFLLIFTIFSRGN